MKTRLRYQFVIHVPNDLPFVTREQRSEKRVKMRLNSFKRKGVAGTLVCHYSNGPEDNGILYTQEF
jgi:hypothetical protein